MARTRTLRSGSAAALLWAIFGSSALAASYLGEVAEFQDYLGASVATGDFNGDGCADVAMLALGEKLATPVPRGLVHVLYGSGPLCVPQSTPSLPKLQLPGRTGLFGGGPTLPASSSYTPGTPVSCATSGGGLTASADPLAGRPAPQIVTPVTLGLPDNAKLSRVQAGGDLNADRFAELIVHVSFAGGGYDAVVLFGSPVGLARPFRLSAFLPSNTFTQPGIGDFDGNGSDDLAIFTANAQGGFDLRVVFGNAAFNSAPQIQIREMAIPATGAAPGLLVAGNFDGAPGDDLAVASPHLNEVRVIYSDGGAAVPRGLNPARFQRFSIGLDDCSPSPPCARSALGSALVAADFDGDGIDDLALGAPGRGPIGGRRGSVIVLRGTSSGVLGSPPREWRPTDLTGFPPHAFSEFGGSLAAADVDGDRIGDLAIGAPGAGHDWSNGGMGIASILFGSSSGLASSDAQLIIPPPTDHGTSSIATSDFARALAFGDFNKDQCPDLAIGDPHHAEFSDEVDGAWPGKAGGVHVYAGKHTRRMSPWQIWVQTPAP